MSFALRFLFLFASCACARLAESRTVQGAAVGFLKSHRSGSSMSVSLQRRVEQVRRYSAAGARTMKKYAYFGSVNIGSHGSAQQSFSVVFDTGSGNLLLPGSKCESSACTKHKRFVMERSQTARAANCDGSPLEGKDSKDELTITFGTGHITGICVEDFICVGALCARGNFVASTEESDQPFGSFSFDGVLGLAPDGMAQSPDFSLMSRMVAHELLKQPVFSVFLSDSDKEASEITFGQIREDHMASELFWVPISTGSGFWEVKIDDIALDGERSKICAGCRVAVDTGTSELAGPSDVMAQLRDRLAVRSDCSNYEKLPKLGFVLNEKILEMSPADYIDKQGSVCSMSVMDLDVPPPKGPLFVFGIPFLQKFFTVYDYENRKVGFAIAKHAGETPAALTTIKQHSASRAA